MMRKIAKHRDNVFKIRKVKPSDKKPILAFCQNTFRWGDYIANVWDSWLLKKNLLAMVVGRKPVGICNASFSKNQVWIEGIRINPRFRRRGYASKLVLKVEAAAKKKRRKISRMIIARWNTRSLDMAKSLGYELEDKWWLYNLKPKKQISKARIISKINNIGNLLSSSTYSDSWEWLTLNKSELEKLAKKGRVIAFFQNKKPKAIGIWNKSQIDADVLQIGFLNGTKTGITAILHFIQNKGYLQKSRCIQILAQQKIDLKMKDLDRRMLFCLMKKDL